MTEKNVQTEVFYPLLKSIISGVLVGLAAVSLYGLYLQVTPWRLFFAIVAIVALLSWLAVIRAMSPSPKLETVQPAKVYPSESTSVKFVASDPAGAFTAGRYSQFPVDIETLIKVCKHLANGADFSMAGLSGRYRPLTRSQFESLRDTMIHDGLAYWVDPRFHAQGCKLTRAGENMVRHFTSSSARDQLLPHYRKRMPFNNKLSSSARARERASERKLS